MTAQPFPIVGAAGSPYSRKLRAVFRYRRIPFVWLNQGSAEAASLPSPKVSLLPRLIMNDPDGKPVARTDTTPLIRELERVVPNDRSVIPDDPALAFLDGLIEDYADEWLTKAMFHYRWAFAADVAKASTILPLWFGMQQSNEALALAAKTFSSRQIERLWVVGSNETTAPLIEDSYDRLLGILENHLQQYPFVMGGRPGTADFGLFGQLTQLALFDPTPSARTLDLAPRAIAYTDLVEDLSGLEPKPDQWFGRDQLPSTFHDLLNEIGRVYAPFLLGNHEALTKGLEQVDCEIDGRRWTQRPFSYQGKCLNWLRDDYATLSTSDRAFVDETLADTGCQRLFA